MMNNKNILVLIIGLLIFGFLFKSKETMANSKRKQKNTLNTKTKAQLIKMINNKNKTIANKNKTIANKNKTIAQKNTIIAKLYIELNKHSPAPERAPVPERSVPATTMRSSGAIA